MFYYLNYGVGALVVAFIQLLGKIGVRCFKAVVSFVGARYAYTK